VVSFDCLVMIPGMRIKWQEYLGEVRFVLRILFNTAMTYPEMICLHDFCILRTATRLFEVHAFVIGDATFCFATNDNLEILIDATLGDGDPLYPEGFIPSNFPKMYEWMACAA
jgi:hypothetical protein